jgi:hypothetical protein
MKVTGSALSAWRDRLTGIVIPLHDASPALKEYNQDV